MAKSADQKEEAELLHLWQQQEASADTAARQRWFSRAAQFLQAQEDHWWCGHSEVTQVMAQVLRHHSTQPLVQQLWERMAGELASCSACVVAFHQAQEYYENTYDNAAPLLDTLHQLMMQRLVPHLRSASMLQPGDALPSPLVTALFEALSFPVCLEDLQVNQALEAALLHLQRTHQLDLTSGGRYAGLYSLLAHPTAQIRAVVQPMVMELGPFEEPEDLQGIMGVLLHWAHVLRARERPEGEQPMLHGRPAFRQPLQPVWRALLVVLPLLRRAAMAQLLSEWSDLVEMLCNALQQQTGLAWAAIGCLERVVSTMGAQLWKLTQMVPSVLIGILAGACWSNDVRVAKTAVQALASVTHCLLAAGNKDLPQLLHQVLVLTLCQLSGNASVQPIVQGMAERAGFATLLKMVGKQMAVHHMVHIWGPTACRLAQAEAGQATSAGRQECLRLCCAVLKEDADTLAACTRNEWTGADGVPGATSGLCAPALWQGLASSRNPMIHEALLAVAAQLALHTAPLPTSSPPQAGIRSPPHSPSPAAGTGFQQQGIAVQEQVHQALIWAAADPDRPAVSSANAIRAAAQPALALHFLREAVITNLEGLVHSLAPAQLAQLLWTETLASLLAVLAGSHPTLRSTAEQFLLAATSEKSLAPALRSLTRRMPEAVDALLSCADSLSPLLEDVPIVQALCSREAPHMLRVLGASLDCLRGAAAGAAHELAQQLWAVVMGWLQAGSAAAKMGSAQLALQQLFGLVAVAWRVLLAPHQPDRAAAASASHQTVDLTLTEGDHSPESSSAEQVLPEDLLWLATLLQWGPLCGGHPATIGAWASTLVKVLQQPGMPRASALPAHVLETAARMLRVSSSLPEATRVQLGPLFGAAAPGNLSMARTPLANLPSRAQSHKPPAAEGSASTSASAQPGSRSSPPAKPRQSSLLKFLSPSKQGAAAGAAIASTADAATHFPQSSADQSSGPSWWEQPHQQRQAPQQQPAHQSRPPAGLAATPPVPVRPSGKRSRSETPAADLDTFAPPEWHSSKTSKPFQAATAARRRPQTGSAAGAGNGNGKVSLTKMYKEATGHPPHIERSSRVNATAAAREQRTSPPVAGSEPGQRGGLQTGRAASKGPKPPASRSPSPPLRLLENDDWLTEPRPTNNSLLNEAQKQQPARKTIRLSAAPKTQLSSAKWAQKRAQPGTAQRPSPPQEVPLLISKVHREVLSWSYSDVIAGRHLAGDLVKVPRRFDGLQHYCGIFKDLLLAELQASLLQAHEEGQRSSSSSAGSGACVGATLRSMQLRGEVHHIELVLDMSDREAVRGDDLIIMQASQASMASSSASSGGALQLMAIIDKLENERVAGGGRCWVVHALICTGRGGHGIILNSTWSVQRLMSWTPHLRQLQALCNVSKLPQTLRQQLFRPQPPQGATAQLSLDKCAHLPQGLRAALQQRFNGSQQAAIAGGMAGSAQITLVQGPPGTGKTSAIIGMVSALLARNAEVAVQQQEQHAGKPHAVSWEGGGQGGSPDRDSSVPMARVLVCAQSNAAIDELIARLATPGLITPGTGGAQESEGMGRVPAMVRLGRMETMSREVQAWHMDRVAEQRMAATGDVAAAAGTVAQAKQRCTDLRAQLDQVHSQIKALDAGQEPGGPPTEGADHGGGSTTTSPSPASTAEPVAAGRGPPSRSTSPPLPSAQTTSSAGPGEGGGATSTKTRSPDSAAGSKRRGRPRKGQDAAPPAKRQRGRLAASATPSPTPDPVAAQEARLKSLKDQRHRAYTQLQDARQQVKAGGAAAARARREVRLAVVRSAEVVACTLSSAGGDLLGLVTENAAGSQPCPLFNALIIDEAAQALEPAALIALQLIAPGARVVLVGDPKQLPPTVLSRAAEASHLAQSLFERLQQAGYPVTLLSEQHRMHPAIAVWPSTFFYQGKLVTARSLADGKARRADFHSQPCFPPLAFFDCRSGEESGGGGASLSNAAEAVVAATLFKGLMRDFGYEVRSAVVLTPYRAQLGLLQREFQKVLGRGAKELAAVEFATVDGFQGREADVVLFSCVRARHPSSSGGVGFLADVRRMNVGLTRGRRAVWVIGHAATLERSPPWKAFMDHTHQQKTHFVVPRRAGELLKMSRQQLQETLTS